MYRLLARGAQVSVPEGPELVDWEANGNSDSSTDHHRVKVPDPQELGKPQQDDEVHNTTNDCPQDVAPDLLAVFYKVPQSLEIMFFHLSV